MKHKLKTLVILTAMLFGSASVSYSQDFNKGLEAYNRGDYTEAIREWEHLRNSTAQLRVGDMYYFGHGVRKNYGAALKHYRIAVEYGDFDANYHLGHMYYFGHGVAQNYKTAYEYFLEGTYSNYAENAFFYLGVMYLHGEGIAQNYRSAEIYFRAAAERGIGGAQYNLGLMYIEGKGVPQNYVLAHMWLNIAGSNEAKNAIGARDALAGQMTSAQIAKAQQMARECQLKDYKDCHR